MAAGWNYDWRRIPFESEPIYDAIRSFHAQVSITSSLRPLHIFSGMLAEVFFGADGQNGFTPKDDGAWDPDTKSIDIWGTGDEPWYFTTEPAAGAFGIEVITAPDAEQGGFVNVCSFVTSMREVAATYEKGRGRKVGLCEKGSVEDLEVKATKAQEGVGRSGFWDWHRLVFHLNTVKGTWNLTKIENDEYPNFKPTDLEAFLKERPDI